MRDGDGQIRQKRNDTLVRALGKEYGPDFAKRIRSDAKLKTVLEKSGYEDLSQFLKGKHRV